VKQKMLAFFGDNNFFQLGKTRNVIYKPFENEQIKNLKIIDKIIKIVPGYNHNLIYLKKGFKKKKLKKKKIKKFKKNRKRRFVFIRFK
jgi:hypothetical protein